MQLAKEEHSNDNLKEDISNCSQGNAKTPCIIENMPLSIVQIGLDEQKGTYRSKWRLD